MTDSFLSNSHSTILEDEKDGWVEGAPQEDIVPAMAPTDGVYLVPLEDIDKSSINPTHSTSGSNKPDRDSVVRVSVLIQRDNTLNKLPEQ